MADDERDFANFVSSRYATLVRSAVLLGCSTTDAEDQVQEALTSCLRHWRRVAAADSPDAYVYRVLANKVLRSRRRFWRGEVPTERLPERAFAADHAHDVAVAQVVRSALGRLSPEQRAVIVLRFFSDLSEAETATALGVASGTVKSRTSRALARLAQDPHFSDITAAVPREAP
jgi:RNA polymerase sigma-70 factor (sigma-E family)